MATATPTISGSRPQRGPHRKKWTRREYEKLIDLDIFTPLDRLELLDGEIVQKMTHKSPHATGISLVERSLNRMLPSGYYLRTQLPLALGDRSEPEPDVAIVIGEPRDYVRSHPTTAILVVEVADSTLRLDRTTKQGIYARAGIAEYWIVNLGARVLEVYRNPGLATAPAAGIGYCEVIRLTADDTVTPLAFADFTISVRDLLP